MKSKLILCLALFLSAGLFGCSTATDSSGMTSNVEANKTYISEIHMIDARNGWAWSGGIDGSNLLLHTSDGGENWQDRTPYGFSYCYEGDCFFDSQTAWVSTRDRKTYRGGLLHTTDGGKSWSVLIQQGTASYGCLTEASKLHFFNAVHGVLNTADFSAGSREECYYETWDGGKNWKPIDILQPGGPYASEPAGAIGLSDIAPDNLGFCPPSNVVIAHGDMGDETPKSAVQLSVSTNLGKTWRELKPPLPSGKYREGLVDFAAPIFQDARHGWLPVRIIKESTNRTDYTFAWTALAFYETRDGGATWTLRPGVIDGDTNGLGDERQVADIVSAKRIFVRCGANFYVTRDGAQSWQMVKPNIDFDRKFPRGGVRQIDFVDKKHGWAVVYETFDRSPHEKIYLYKTTDGGEIWTELSLKILP
jgi:photosystem II stability/assembly factor-like uncharacterized protein